MKQRSIAHSFFLLTAVALVLVGCLQKGNNPRQLHANDPCALALAPHTGSEKIDQEIARLQQQARAASDPAAALNQLGWLFVAKARLSYDPGFYKLAEQCAACLGSRSPQNPDALLLRGHVLHNLHRFKEAEPLARELVAGRGTAFDHGLLGDVLLEQGNLYEATAEYQRMLDLKPSLQSYSRAAHLRWLKGDLQGAGKLMRMAVKAGSNRDPESVAWAYSRLAYYEWQSGASKNAMEACETARTRSAGGCEAGANTRLPGFYHLWCLRDLCGPPNKQEGEYFQ